MVIIGSGVLRMELLSFHFEIQSPLLDGFQRLFRAKYCYRQPSLELQFSGSEINLHRKDQLHAG